MFYEGVLLSALWIAAGFLFLALHKGATTGSWRILFQFYLIVVTAAYCVAFWCRGQTLPMKTWHILLVNAHGQPPTVAQAILRFILAVPSLCLLGMGLLWAVVDRDRQFLHDRLTGLSLVDSRARNSAATD